MKRINFKNVGSHLLWNRRYGISTSCIIKVIMYIAWYLFFFVNGQLGLKLKTL